MAKKFKMRRDRERERKERELAQQGREPTQQEKEWKKQEREKKKQRRESRKMKALKKAEAMRSTSGPNSTQQDKDPTQQERESKKPKYSRGRKARRKRRQDEAELKKTEAMRSIFGPVTRSKVKLAMTEGLGPIITAPLRSYNKDQKKTAEQSLNVEKLTPKEKKSRMKKNARERQPARLKAAKAAGPNHRSKYTTRNKSNFLNHVKFDPRRTSRGVARIPLHQNTLKKSEFRLHLPIDGLTDTKVMPWYGRSSPEQKNSLEESFRTASKLQTDNLMCIRENTLIQLDKEMLDFCSYVRLTITERTARERFVQYVTDLAESIFHEKTANSSKFQRPQERQNHEQVTVQIFGSFATHEICTFNSDVDLALWGVIPSPTHTIFDGAKAALNIEQTNYTSNASMKEKRIQKWRDMLDEVCEDDSEADSDDKDQNGHSSSKLLKEQKKQLWSNALAESSSPGKESDNGDSIDRTDSTPASKNSSGTPASQNTDGSSGTTDKKDPGNDSLFVIDRVGVDLEDDKTSKVESEDKPLVSEMSDEKKEESSPNQQDDKPSILEHSEPNKVSDAQAAQRAEPGSFRVVPVAVNNDDQSSQNVIDLCTGSDNDNDSDDDTADKLESYHKKNDNKAAAQASNKWSSSDSSDNEDNAYLRQIADRHFDETGMDVSFVNKQVAGAPPITSNAPKGETKKLVISALASLGRSLRRGPVAWNVEVRSKARVPIINMTTKLGFEGDIAIGGHVGADTSQYVASQVQRFASFAPVVLVLKIILNQQGLDKPFTGGLGSYKLYVLVAYHLERHLSSGGSDRPSEVLLSFFQRYGEPGSPPHHTVLGTHVTVKSDGGAADLNPVFHVDSCVTLFQKCWALFKKNQEAVCDNNKSYLSCLINDRRLQHERKECLDRAHSANNHLLPSLSSKKSNIERDHPGKVSAGRKINHVFTRDGNSNGIETSRDHGSPKQTHVDGLPTGETPLRSHRGALIPKIRPDVEARREGKAANPKSELTGRALKNRKNKKKQKRDEALWAFANREI